jgi:UDP-N-acetylmuramate--alanine ligase
LNFTKVHIIGIGGISMSGIAKILLKRGCQVSGSDIKENEQVKLLKDLGAQVHIGHQASNIKHVDAVVYTNAVEADNIELVTARKKGIKIFKRAEFIAELFKEKDTIAITGTHGKTTTTSMLATIFVSASKDPSVMVGGNLDLIDGNIKSGNGKYFITESDESDGSLTFFDPYYAVLTNIEWDHFNYYKSKKDLINKFQEFISKIPKNGALLLWGAILKDYPKLLLDDIEYYTYGFNDENYQARNIHLDKFKSSFKLYKNDEYIDEVKLNVPGRHNILNALAAYGVSEQAGLSKDEIIKGLNEYKGVNRRFEKKGIYQGALVVDDYAHHPTEIINTLETAVGIEPAKLYVVFQPHRYSRTQNLMKEFSRSFDKADQLILTDIYSASEEPIEGVSSKKLFNLINEHKNENSLDIELNYLSKFNEIISYLKDNLSKNDLLITIGAGNVHEIGEALVGEQSEK